MNNLEYLNEISKSNRPEKPVKKSFLPNMNFGLVMKVLAGITAVFVVIVAVVALTGNNTNQAADLTRRLYNRSLYVRNIINTYNPNIKSSQMRSINYSLSGALSNAANQLAGYLYLTAEEGNEQPLVDSTQAAWDDYYYFQKINTQLTNAKLNGLLDRNYETQLHLQIELLLSMIGELKVRDRNANLQVILNNYADNLNVILNSMDNNPPSRGV